MTDNEKSYNKLWKSDIFPNSPMSEIHIYTIYINVYVCIYMEWNVLTQLYLTLCSPVDCSLPGSSVHGVSQVRILEWIAMRYSRASSWPRDQTQVSYLSPALAGRFFTIIATWEAYTYKD